jgi:membrane-associated phospholipid phosphatase
MGASVKWLRAAIAAVALLTFGFNSKIARAQMTFSAATETPIVASPPQPAESDSREPTLATNVNSPFDPASLEVSWRKMPMRFLPDEKDIWLLPNIRQADIFSDSSKVLEGSIISAGRHSSGEDSAEDQPTTSWPQSQAQTRRPGHDGLVMRSVKRTLQDQKELYLSPFKPSNIKWDALELGGTAGLLAADRHIEKHIGTAHYNFYQATSDVAIGGLGATLAGVWIWGIKGDHPHAKETGVLELETLVNTFLIYTPTQLLAARQRPDEGNGNGDFWKHHSINTSFPGGHAMFTFAMATVVSHEYPQKWVQLLAYSAASIVTVTRFMARDHWSSDMFIGAALGIGIGSHVFHAHCNPELSDSCKRHTRWIF